MFTKLKLSIATAAVLGGSAALAGTTQLSFNFSFVNNAGNYDLSSVVKGTVSGLVEGMTTGVDTTATVTQTTGTGTVGTYSFEDANRPAFTVLNGEVTQYDIVFHQDNGNAFLRLSQDSFRGVNSFLGFENGSQLGDAEATTGVVTFTPFGATGAVPEPAAWALIIGGFGLVGATMRRRASLGIAA